MSKKQSLVLKVAKRAFELVATSRLLKYSSKFTNRIYSQHQHFVFLVLKKHLKTTYRDVSDVIGEMPRVLEAFHQSRRKHRGMWFSSAFSTLGKRSVGVVSKFG